MTTRDYFSPHLAEDTPAAARAGARALGRALAHAAHLDGQAPNGIPSMPFVFARALGFTPSLADLAVASYTDLLTGTGL